MDVPGVNYQQTFCQVFYKGQPHLHTILHSLCLQILSNLKWRKLLAFLLFFYFSFTFCYCRDDAQNGMVDLRSVSVQDSRRMRNEGLVHHMIEDVMFKPRKRVRLTFDNIISHLSPPSPCAGYERPFHFSLSVEYSSLIFHAPSDIVLSARVVSLHFHFGNSLFHLARTIPTFSVSWPSLSVPPLLPARSPQFTDVPVGSQPVPIAPSSYLLLPFAFHLLLT